MTKITISKGSPMIIKGDNNKFIQEMFNILNIVKLRFKPIKKVIINPRYELGS